MTGRGRLSLAHLTLLASAPPDLLRAAASAGFERVGLRVVPATEGEDRYPLAAGSPMLRDTVSLLDDLGLEVLDVEALRLDGSTSPAQWLPALELGAVLGARVLNVIGADGDRGRL